MKRLTVLACATVALAAWAGQQSTATGQQKEGEKGWVPLFNGKDLTGWKWHPQSPGKWEVKDGFLVGSGEKASHLFTDRDNYEDFEFRVVAKINDKGNSGQYFRATFAPGYSPGYEAQINATHSDVIKTGSLYPGGAMMLSKEERALMEKTTIVREQLHKPDEWFTQVVIAKGNHFEIYVNGKKTVEWTDTKNRYPKGHLAVQGHDAMKVGGKTFPSVVTFKSIEVKEMPSSAKK